LTFRPRASPPSPTWTIGYVGRLVAEKGLDTLVAALAAWSERANVQLRFVGAGPQCESLQAQAQASGLAERVKFLPPMPAAAVARFMNSLSVFVLPSRTTRNWKEQFGRVLTEAMACQVPVIGSDSGAIPEVIGDAGLIFPEGNAAGLAECLHRLYTSPDLCRELAERGFVRVQQHYTQAHVAIQTAEFYRQLMTR